MTKKTANQIADQVIEKVAMPYREVIGLGVEHSKWLRDLIKKIPKDLQKKMRGPLTKDLRETEKEIIQDRISQKAFEDKHGGKNMDQVLNSILKN